MKIVSQRLIPFFHQFSGYVTSGPELGWGLNSSAPPYSCIGLVRQVAAANLCSLKAFEVAATTPELRHLENPLMTARSCFGAGKERS